METHINYDETQQSQPQFVNNSMQNRVSTWKGSPHDTTYQEYTHGETCNDRRLYK